MLAGNMAKSLRKPLRSVWVRRVWIRKCFTATAARKKYGADMTRLHDSLTHSAI